MKRIIFHIGNPKTGSSSLQAFFAQSVDILRLRGINYLQIGEFALGKSGSISSGNGAYLARSILSPESPDFLIDGEKIRQNLIHTLSICDENVFIISSELFTFANIPAFQKLVRYLSRENYAVECFYFIRSQVQSISSSYVQQVKRHGCTVRPEAWILQNYRTFSFLKVNSFYLSMRAVFGDKVTCRNYDSASQHTTGIIRSFFEAIGINLDFEIEQSVDVNPGLTEKQIALTMLLNKFKPHMKFTDKIVALNTKLSSVYTGHSHNFLPLVIVNEILEFFAAENRELAQIYFHREELFARHDHSLPTVVPDVDEITLLDAVEFMLALFVAADDERRLSRN